MPFTILAVAFLLAFIAAACSATPPSLTDPRALQARPPAHQSRRPSGLVPFPPRPPCIDGPAAQYWDPKHNTCQPCGPHATSCVYSDWATACEPGFNLFGGECFEGRLAREAEREEGAVKALRREAEVEVAKVRSEVQSVMAKVERGRAQKVFRMDAGPVKANQAEQASATQSYAPATTRHAAAAAQPTIRPDEFFIG